VPATKKRAVDYRDNSTGLMAHGIPRRKPRRTVLVAPAPGVALLRFAGKATGLPPDLAENHDHYLHGLPKRRP